LSRAASLILCAFLLASCGEKKSGQTSGSKASSKASRSETRAPGSGGSDAAESKRALRESFDTALASADPGSREKALERIAWDAIDLDPDLSRQAFANLPVDSIARAKLAAHFAMRLAESDPEQALEWARGLGPSERSEAISRIAVVISTKEPERATTLIAEELPPGRPRDRAAVQVVQRWSQETPSAAAEWIGAFPPGEARSAGLKLALVRWLEADASSAATWIAGRDDEALKLESIKAVADHLRSADTSVKAARLAAFSDPEIRSQLENLLAQPRP
jgi:hypothetical protein